MIHNKILSEIAPFKSSFFEKRVYWVTGAGTGYGKVIAQALAFLGANVIISSRRKTALQECKQDINLNNLDILVCDITNNNSIDYAIEYIKNNYGKCDGIIHSAALPPDDTKTYPLLDSSFDELLSILHTNTLAPWYISKTIIDKNIYAESFRTIFISSEAGFSCKTLSSGIYNLSKTALNSMASSLALEIEAKYKNEDIQFNTLVADVALSEMNPNSDTSPTIIINMVLKLLTQPKGKPNGMFFHSNGENLYFLNRDKHERIL
ncbi:SDR family oxidoreductase [Sulfurimonas sp.]|uniref:SDR family oxidoreductase n=1 Tax=Sulfurimonas sp. TaxID=2022749 RepID=UPI00356AD999